MVNAHYQKQNSIALFSALSIAHRFGQTVEVRGSVIREAQDLQIRIHPQYPFVDFPSRKYNIDYFKKEMLWKLTGDPFNESIKEHAKMWESVQNTDGSFNSNYGQYWFGEQLGLHKAFNELILDKHSRRATIPMLSAKHIGHGVNDTVCTGHITFRIRQNVLTMSVSMRSSDQIFGLGTDIPTFAVLYRMMLAMLQIKYPGTMMGPMCITADSSHIYERHFEMVNKIIDGKEAIESLIEMPLMGSAEAFSLAACKGDVDSSWGEFSAWLLETSNG